MAYADFTAEELGRPMSEEEKVFVYFHIYLFIYLFTLISFYLFVYLFLNSIYIYGLYKKSYFGTAFL